MSKKSSRDSRSISEGYMETPTQTPVNTCCPEKTLLVGLMLIRPVGKCADVYSAGGPVIMD